MDETDLLQNAVLLMAPELGRTCDALYCTLACLNDKAQQHRVKGIVEPATRRERLVPQGPARREPKPRRVTG